MIWLASMTRMRTIGWIVIVCLFIIHEEVTGAAGESTGPVTIGAYYYPWYRAAVGRNDSTSIGWMRKALRGRLVPRQLPKLGVYDSRDSKVIGDHIAQSKLANVDFWVVSWWGPGSSGDITFREHILTHPGAGQLKYAVFYEPTGRLGSFDNPSYANLLGDFKHIAENYFDRPEYLRINGKPVVFIYLTRVYFRDRGLETLAQLRKQYPNIYIVGDDVFGPRYQGEFAERWDAVTAYDVYGQSLQQHGATRAALEQLNANYRNARKIANEVGTGFVPAVSPGFNDRAVRAGHPGRGRYLKDASDSREGDLFRELLRTVAIPNSDPLAQNMIMITSFNEWYEDTQIEASTGTGGSTDKDDSKSGDFYTEGDKYADYGNLFLDILRQETSKVR